MMSIPNNIGLNIQVHFETFLNNKINTLMNMSVDSIEINPFLIAATSNQLGIRTPHDLAEWVIRQRLERGIVTSFGSTLQNIAKEFCNEKPLPGLTARLSRDGKIYNMVIKSAANHNIQVTQSIQKALLRTRELEPGAVPVFAACYGDEDRMGAIVKKHMRNVQILIGRPFWDFVSGHPNCYDQILKIAYKVDKNYVDPDVGSLKQVMGQKIASLEEEIKKIYVNDADGIMNDILEDTT